MASRQKVSGALPTGLDVEEALDELEQLIERSKVLYEQYFLGLQKTPPSQLHRKAERLILAFTQQRIRNTAMRFRFTTLSQKFGSYNTYWKRTLRQIEQGTYVRHVQRAHRKAQAAGKDTPDELLVGLPKRLRQKIMRDREQLAAKQTKDEARHSKRRGTAAGEEAQAPAEVRKAKPLFHEVDESMLSGNFDMDAMFDAIVEGQDQAAPKPAAPKPAAPKPAATSSEAGFDEVDFDAQFDAMLTPDSTPPPPPPPTQTRTAGGRRAGAWSRQQAGRRSTTTQPARGPTAKPPPPTPPPTPPAMPTKQQLAARHRQSERAARSSTSSEPQAPPGMSSTQSRDLYKRYVQAKKLVGDDVSQVTYDKLMRTLNKQAPKIMQQHRATGVDFNVVIKDDKVVLKAKPLRKK